MQYKKKFPLFCAITIISLMSCNTFKPLAKPIPAIVKADTVAALPPVQAINTGNSKTDTLLERLLKQHPAYFDSILQNRQTLNLQFIYTQVDRGANGIAKLTHHYFNVNKDNYFYPASAVKLPICMLSLQKLNELKDKGIDKNTTLLTESAYSGQTAVYNDPTTPDGKPTIAHYIKKAFLASDNDAFNRLYEFLGQQYINDELHKKNYKEAQILHRLQVSLNEEENRHTNPVRFVDSSNHVLYQQAMQVNTAVYESRKDSLGKGYYDNDKLVNSPMDFSTKNRLNLQDLHSILISLAFPYRLHADERFNLTEDDRRFLLEYMSKWPNESIYPPYSSDTANYYPAYCKFLLLGAQKGIAPENIRIFNKVGDAYGQLTDVAYIVDFDKKIEFFLSATIYCNKDEILNDDQYDYATIGYPFMQQIGQIIYDYEVKREKKFLPDLSELKFEYEKK